jgi:hypothetical protein
MVTGVSTREHVWAPRLHPHKGAVVGRAFCADNVNKQWGLCNEIKIPKQSC